MAHLNNLQAKPEEWEILFWIIAGPLIGALYVAGGVLYGFGWLVVIWREAGREPELVPPRFERGAKVGSGSVVLAGVVIGENALVGAGSVVTRHVPAGAIAYRVPACVRDRHGVRRRITQESAALL